MRCKSCNSILREIQYQSRSADEPQTLALCCPQCPLSIDKFFAERVDPHLYLTRRKRIRKSTPYMGEVVFQTRTMLRVTTRTNIIIPEVLHSAMASNHLDGDSRLFKAYHNGPWQGLALCKLRSCRISLNAEIITFDVVESQLESDNKYCDFLFVDLELGTAFVDNKDKILMQTVDPDAPDDILQRLSMAYSIGFVPDSLPAYISRVFLGSMSNMNARAYDAFTAEDGEHVFSTKPDGERMWLVKSGSAWFFCRRLLDFKIEGWVIDKTLSSTNASLVGPILDTELMIGFPPILIDILADSSTLLSPYDRNVEWIYTKMNELIVQFPYLSTIHMRKFFDRLADAEMYASTVPYPTDGLVAISVHSTDMKKLKPTKSMELEFSNAGYLLSKEGTKMMKLSNETAYSQGSIIEIRFSLDESTFNIHEHFERFDKRSANSDSAISSILASYMEPESDSVVRTALWRWSNKVRFYMYEKAYSMNKEKHIVIDIGSGTGQSSEAFDKMPGCSFILVEPDSEKCNLLAKRLSVRKVHTNPRSLIPEISGLRRGTTKYHILNVSLQDILSDKPCVNNIKGTIKCAIACFSAQFTVDQIDTLSTLEIPSIGCYYDYENIQIGQCIIDYAGIRMKRLTETQASVKWGSDKSYTEPVITKDDLPFTVSQISAVNIVPAPTRDIDGPVQSLCSHLQLLVSK